MCCAVSVDARLGVNVALNRPSYQISTKTFAGVALHAGYANDGNHETRVMIGPCIHTENEMNPWWAVDLEVALYVDGVNFTNRNAARTCSLFHVDLMRTARINRVQ